MQRPTDGLPGTRGGGFRIRWFPRGPNRVTRIPTRSVVALPYKMRSLANRSIWRRKQQTNTVSRRETASALAHPCAKPATHISRTTCNYIAGGSRDHGRVDEYKRWWLGACPQQACG